ncbi:MAG: M15 family metallopeptidase [Epsilonproteobacteria bacterium]|nr:M15 family metallopeptidase [Campylobacterota bacterium]
MHSYGIAIDLAPNTTQYWKDEASSETAKIGYKNTMPLSIVRIFEKHGFIWGGRWYHYDTMHFEYRPELLAPSCKGKI